MMPLLVLALMAGLAQAQAVPSFQRQLSFEAPNGTTLTYGIAIPRKFDRKQPHTLVLALHPGTGGPARIGYGGQVMGSIFYPGLSELEPVMVAPDCPTSNWGDPAVEQALVALIEQVRKDYVIDSHRILVTGYSMGARGTWFMEAHHSDLFSAAIVMAGRTEEPVEALGKIPTYVINSRADQTVPFAQAEERVNALTKLGRPIKFEALDGLEHYQMGGYVEPLQRAGRWVVEQWKKTVKE